MSQDPFPFHDKNPFEVLGLQGSEDLPSIRKAFLRIAAQSHPDRLRMKSPEAKAQALETFLLAKKAFEVLTPPDKRREWSDRMAARASTPVPPRPGPALTPAPVHGHGVPVASPPRPGAFPATPARGVPTILPSRPGPALTPVQGTPVARPGPALTPVGIPTATPPPRPGQAAASAVPRTPSSSIPPIAEPKPAASLPSRTGALPAAMALQLYKLGMLALESSDYAKALDLFAKAARVAPTPRHQAMELVSRGHQYLSTRFYDRARESFERALQLLPECREARMGLEHLDKQSGRPLKGR